MTREEFIADAVLSQTDDCILWPYAVRKSSGYGAHSESSTGRKLNHDAHRYVCRHAHGAPGPDQEAAHTCGNKLCVNPRHLYWTDHTTNMADAKRHGTLRGGGRYRQRFRAAEVELIRTSAKSLLELAAEFNSDVAYIGRLRRSAARRAA